ncbi:PH domain-containing protein [Sphingobacterium faecale]|uniref:PH domain-containing protein n=1 Tax=Sphingobacterium faecale TaxID=2803775 RepID=A0ABS1RAD0_9SPHI|nr:PH domain-containing protein [Sphingobacterium faecale]MBL1411295.1 PH domain-containing protein [Sphingobacterium faecale]
MSLDKFIQDGQDIKVVEKIYGKIADMLTHGETISYIALQKKPAVTLLPDSITISDKRIFLCEFTKLGLATNFEIFSWKDIKDIAFKEEIFGSKVTVIPFTGENLSIDYIPKVQARKLYQLIKEALEHVKIEQDEPVATTKIIAPVRDIYGEPKKESPAPAAPVFETPAQPIVEPPVESVEETKVKPTPFFGQATPSPVSIPAEDDELTLKLKKLKALFDKQLISQAEYENKKAEILSQL